MNLLDKKKVGWLLWLTPFIFACESEEILSLPQEPGDQTLNLYFTEIPLSYSLVQADSVYTRRPSTNNSGSSYHMLVGNYQDEAFGDVQAQAFTEITIGTKAEVTAEDNFDSLVLIMVNDYFYGDADNVSNQTVGVYELADTLERKAYYSTDKADYLPNPLGELNFTPNPEVNDSPDTLRFALDNAFGEELLALAKAGSSTLNTDSAFREYFPGITLASAAGSRAVSGFDPSRTSMVLYFSTNDETTSTAYTFGINNSRANTFNNISVDRSGTPLAGITTPNQETMAADGKFYLQSGTGLYPTLSLQPVVDYIKSVEDSSSTARLRINRVDLYIGTNLSNDGQPLPEAVYINGFNDGFVFKTDTAQISRFQLGPLPVGLFADNIQSQPFLSGQPSATQIGPSESRYQARITNYLLYLLGDTFELDANFIVAPTSAGATINQIVAEPDSVIAKVYYTLLE